MSRMFLWMVRAVACVALVGVGACGGGGDPGNVSFPQKTISGTVVSGGKALANAQVYVWCYIRIGLSGQVPNENSVLTFYTTTDSNGAYSVRADTADGPCIIEAKDPVQGTTLHSYVSAFNSSTVTANITPITDSIIALTLGTGNFTAVTSSLKTWASKLYLELPKGTDVAAWNSMRTKLLSGTYIKATNDVNAMPADPVTGALTLSTATPTPAGYFSLLQKLNAANIDSSVLQAITQEQRFVVVPGTNGAEIQDLKSTMKYIWHRCVLGMVWTGTTCSGTPRYLNWSEVDAAASSAPKSPVSRIGIAWQYASNTLLIPLLTSNGTLSSLDPTLFPNDPGGWTWAGPTFSATTLYVANVVNTQSTLSGVAYNDGSLMRVPSTAPATAGPGKCMVRLVRLPL